MFWYFLNENQPIKMLMMNMKAMVVWSPKLDRGNHWNVSCRVLKAICDFWIYSSISHQYHLFYQSKFSQVNILLAKQTIKNVLDKRIHTHIHTYSHTHTRTLTSFLSDFNTTVSLRLIHHFLSSRVMVTYSQKESITSFLESACSCLLLIIPKDSIVWKSHQMSYLL